MYLDLKIYVARLASEFQESASLPITLSGTLALGLQVCLLSARDTDPGPCACWGKHFTNGTI